MTDHFWANVHMLLNLTKDLGPTAPDPSDGRVIRRVADLVAVQRTNPFEDQTLPQLLAIDFAEATLAWLDAPADQAARFKKTRLDLLQTLGVDE